jgi:pilus assembly protein Flp/PilA
MIARFFRDESGATAIEYGLMAAMISVAIIAAVSLLGDALDENLTETANQVGAVLP